MVGSRTFIAGRTTVRGIHMTEMRDALRELVGNPNLQFQRGNIDPVNPGTRTISKKDLEYLRGWVGDHERANRVAARVYIHYDDSTVGVSRPNSKGRYIVL